MRGQGRVGIKSQEGRSEVPLCERRARWAVARSNICNPAYVRLLWAVVQVMWACATTMRSLCVPPLLSTLEDSPKHKQSQREHPLLCTSTARNLLEYTRIRAAPVRVYPFSSRFELHPRPSTRPSTTSSPDPGGAFVRRRDFGAPRAHIANSTAPNGTYQAKQHS